MTKAILVTVTILFCLPLGKAQVSPFTYVLTHRDELPSRPNLAPTPQLTLTIPAASELSVQLLSGIHSQVSRVGDPVKAQVLETVYVNGQIALPSGSLLDGRITRIRSAGRVHRAAELGLRFEQITLPDGQEQPISATITGLENGRALRSRLDAEGFLKGSRLFSSKGIAAGLIGFGVFAVPRAQLLGASALSTLLPLGSAGLLCYEILWPRGNDVHLPPDTRCRIRLNYPLAVRAAG